MKTVTFLLITYSQAVYFKPPYEERNPELLISQQKVKFLKDILQEKHLPFHKFLRPHTASTLTSTTSHISSHSKQFSLFHSKEKQRKIRVVNEKQRKSRIINERICSVNRDQTYNQSVQYKWEERGNDESQRHMTPQKAKVMVERALEMEVKREKVVNQDKKLLNMRGGTVEWRQRLRDYKDTDNVKVHSQERIRQNFNHCMYFDQSPLMKEQQIQTIKSVFKPLLKDEQLSAIFPYE